MATKQGIAWDGTYYYTTDNYTLIKWDASWNTVATVADAHIAAGIQSFVDHNGALCVVNGLLYIPMETYPNSPYNQQYIAIFNASDLSWVRNYNISAQLRETSAIAYNPADNLLYISDFTNGASIQKYQLDGSYVGLLTLSMTIANIQGLTFFNGSLYISASVANNVYKFTTTGTYVGNVYHYPTGADTTEIEGITNNGTNLIFIGFVNNNFSKAYFLTPI